jgi:hypothetical protein
MPHLRVEKPYLQTVILRIFFQPSTVLVNKKDASSMNPTIPGASAIILF